MYQTKSNKRYKIEVTQRARMKHLKGKQIRKKYICESFNEKGRIC